MAYEMFQCQPILDIFWSFTSRGWRKPLWRCPRFAPFANISLNPA